jgi:hypothetical protein
VADRVAVEASATAGGRMMSGRRSVPGSSSLARAISGAAASPRRRTRDGPDSRRPSRTLPTTTKTGSSGPPTANFSTASGVATSDAGCLAAPVSPRSGARFSATSAAATSSTPPTHQRATRRAPDPYRNRAPRPNTPTPAST